MNLKKLILFTGLLAVLGSTQAATDNIVAYTVTEGEDIQTIAGQYDLSVTDILVSNGKESEDVTVGEVIYIPPKHATGFFNPDTGVYTVAKGDDLLEISRRFGTTVEAIEALNGLPNSDIQTGANLQIPD
ncbi:LysM peptidoglycan-binding domain-containing protein [Thiorhodococcus mannitoliphagus]|uniref:LysM peptidoglycan-binding domain-containing protein n=1 Tax=Thiorhodococcus mannitoliphagus TaxID=329406 RepID=A0A6P1E1R5_9GAMM|nr:LysM peptidoglycan-binding domain-containing protein [Thiorhodococcus mannitoliphagus]NEX21934.1 LysM peptidoglycan-binding domain-containing protein [Thiorhodococcus mannitoliphagus]